MRRLLLAAVLGAGACGREPESPPAAPVAAPIAAAAPDPAPPDRIAFVRGGGLWTVGADGASPARLLPATIPQVGEPCWSPDRRLIAFTAAVESEFNLFPRNVFVVDAGGGHLRQVTPMPRSGLSVENIPKGVVRGRAILAFDAAREAVAGVRVTAFGLRKPGITDSEGNFQTYLPVGGGWVKLSGTAGGRPVLAWRFTTVVEGRVTDLKDVTLSPGGEDSPSAPAWSDGGRHLLYVMRHSLIERAPGSPLVTLRRISVDGGGDAAFASPSGASIIAGPVIRGPQAWCKMSDGLILCFDLASRRVVDTRPGGVCAPDALAVSADGAAIATLQMNPAGDRSIVVLRGAASETVASFPAGEAAPRALDFSPDGSRLVLDRHAADGSSELWILDLAAKRLARLLADGSDPVWNGR